MDASDVAGALLERFAGIGELERGCGTLAGSGTIHLDSMRDGYSPVR